VRLKAVIRVLKYVVCDDDRLQLENTGAVTEHLKSPEILVQLLKASSKSCLAIFELTKKFLFYTQ